MNRSMRTLWIFCICLSAMSFLKTPVTCAQSITQLEEEAWQSAVEKVQDSVVQIRLVGGLEQVDGVYLGSAPNDRACFIKRWVHYFKCISICTETLVDIGAVIGWNKIPREACCDGPQSDVSAIESQCEETASRNNFCTRKIIPSWAVDDCRWQNDIARHHPTLPSVC